MNDITSDKSDAWKTCPYCKTTLKESDYANELAYADDDYTDYFYRCPQCGAICQVEHKFAFATWRLDN